MDKPNPNVGQGQSGGGPQSRSAPGAGGQAARQVPVIEVDDSRAVATYSNFCRVRGGPDELMIDFGLNMQGLGAGVPSKPVPIDHRIVLNYVTAKRMLHALALAVQHHESIFGPIEVDAQKRMIRPAPGGNSE